MKEKKHYATIYKERIWFLEKMIKKYYMANYHARSDITFGGIGICAVSVMEGNEERLIINDVEGLKQIINELPLYDCGVG